MATLGQVLGGSNLSGLIHAIKSGVPRRLPEGFYKEGRKVKGNTASYFLVRGSRDVARYVAYGSTSKAVQLRDVSQVQVILISSTENISIPAGQLVNSVDPNSTGQGVVTPMGEAEITRQLKEFKVRYENLRTVAPAMALAQGSIAFDSDGNIMPTTAGSQFSVNFGIPATNQGQLPTTAGSVPTNLITASWATAGTDMMQNILGIKEQSIKQSGYELRNVLYGKNIPKYFAQNTSMQAFLSRNQVLGREYADTAVIPKGTAGLDWTYMGETFYVDQNGAIQKVIGDDQVIFTPAPEEDWFENVIGSTLVPTDVGAIANDPSGGFGNLREVFGMYAYGKIEHDPVAAKVVAGDVFLPLIKVPGAVFQATVVF